MSSLLPEAEVVQQHVEVVGGDLLVRLDVLDQPDGDVKDERVLGRRARVPGPVEEEFLDQRRLARPRPALDERVSRGAVLAAQLDPAHARGDAFLLPREQLLVRVRAAGDQLGVVDAEHLLVDVVEVDLRLAVGGGQHHHA